MTFSYFKQPSVLFEWLSKIGDQFPLYIHGKKQQDSNKMNIESFCKTVCNVQGCCLHFKLLDICDQQEGNCRARKFFFFSIILLFAMKVAAVHAHSSRAGIFHCPWLLLLFTLLMSNNIDYVRAKIKALFHIYS